MKSKFRGYIRHSEADFDALWSDATFSFDANVLLNAYRLDKSATDEFLGALKSLKGRAWLTHQAAAEFFRHREGKVQEQFAIYDGVKKHLSGLSAKFHSEFPRHPHIPIKAIVTALKSLADEWLEQIDAIRKNHIEPIDDAPLTVFLDVFDGMAGDKPADEDLKRWHREAAERFEKKVPPGFADAGKGQERQYGDVVLWFQLIEYAKVSKKPVVFVTDDAKEDWWYRPSGKTIGPHLALAQEMYEKAGVLFHAYSMSQFVKEAGKAKGKPAEKDVIDNIKDVERSRLESASPELQAKAMDAARRILAAPFLGRDVYSAVMNGLAALRSPEGIQSAALEGARFAEGWPADFKFHVIPTVGTVGITAGGPYLPFGVNERPPSAISVPRVAGDDLREKSE